MGRPRLGPNEHYVDSFGDVHIKLTQGKEAIVSSEDYPTVAPFRWFAHRDRTRYKEQFYASTNIKKPNGRFAKLAMHTLIFEPEPGLEVDHLFGDGLDNRRGRTSNVTHRGNCQNLHHRKSSKYPGVDWYGSRNKWRSGIIVNGKRKHLGYFTEEYDAFSAYRNECIKLGISCPQFSAEKPEAA